MALEDMTVAELRDLANKEHVQLGGLTLKADIIDALEKAGVGVEEPEAEPQAEVEGEEPEGYEYDQPQDEQPAPDTAEKVEAEDDVSLYSDAEGQKAGGYVIKDGSWTVVED